MIVPRKWRRKYKTSVSFIFSVSAVIDDYVDINKEQRNCQGRKGEKRSCSYLILNVTTNINHRRLLCKSRLLNILALTI